MTLFGYGKTTAAIAKKFGHCAIFDDKFDSEEAFATNKLMPMEAFEPEKSELEVTSPGIPPSHPALQKAKHLISEYDLFAEEMPFSVWVTGTNGKTTTVRMLHHLLEAKGAQAGGNVGTPLAELDPEAPIWILETSSFTLHYTTKAKPNLYIILPITPDHVEWHGSFQAYEEAKLKPLAWMEEGETVILPAKYADRESDGFLVPYDREEDLAERFGLELDKIAFPPPFRTDALLALAVTKILFNEADYDLLNRFVLDPHKLEPFTDALGRTWVDDSKATNPDAAIQALERYKGEKIHLVLGGDDKGADLSTLLETLEKADVEVYAIGKNAVRLTELCEERKIPVTTCGFLEVAVERIHRCHDKKSVALLSPAAASLDQFSSYKERGEKFKEFVGNLS